MDKRRDLYLAMLKKMVTIRLFEDKAVEAYNAGKAPGRILPQTGAEGVAVGTGAALREGDFITSTHRPNGHLIAKGIDLGSMLAEIYGRSTGASGGKGGPMHIADISRGILGANGIVGGGFPIAVGAAFAARYKGTDNVVVCFFGDGAANQGSFHEALNLAAIWRLPVIFVCENNYYGMSMSAAEHMSVANVADRAASYGMPGRIVDGNDVLAVYEAVSEAVGRARSGEGPSLIECKTFRRGGHSADDKQAYRPKDELARWQEKDPILRLKSLLLREGLATEADLQAVDAAAAGAVAAAVEYATASPYPAPTDALRDVYSD